MLRAVQVPHFFQVSAGQPLGNAGSEIEGEASPIPVSMAQALAEEGDEEGNGREESSGIAGKGILEKPFESEGDCTS